MGGIVPTALRVEQAYVSLLFRKAERAAPERHAPFLTEAMRAYPDALDLQVTACRALALLSSPPMAADTADLVLRAMARFPRCVDLQAAGCTLLEEWSRRRADASRLVALGALRRGKQHQVLWPDDSVAWTLPGPTSNSGFCRLPDGDLGVWSRQKHARPNFCVRRAYGGAVLLRADLGDLSPIRVGPDFVYGHRWTGDREVLALPDCEQILGYVPAGVRSGISPTGDLLAVARRGLPDGKVAEGRRPVARLVRWELATFWTAADPDMLWTLEQSKLVVTPAQEVAWALPWGGRPVLVEPPHAPARPMLMPPHKPRPPPPPSLSLMSAKEPPAPLLLLRLPSKVVATVSPVPHDDRVVKKVFATRPGSASHAVTEQEAFACFQLMKVAPHPNLIRMFRFEREAGTGYVALHMERGIRDLFTVVMTCPAFEPSERTAAHWTAQYVAGLHHMAATAKLAHGDIKLENAVEVEPGRLALIDFERSKPLDQPVVAAFAAGTKGYAPPETLFPGATHTLCWLQPVDVWALGVVLVALLTRKQPWDVAAHGDTRYDAWAEVHASLVHPDGHESRATVWGWLFPADPVPSPDCLQLLWGMLDPNPATRMSLEAVRTHGWFAAAAAAEAAEAASPSPTK